MPIIKLEETKNYNIALWSINESLEGLIKILEPTNKELETIKYYKNIQRKKQNIASRILLNKLSKKKEELLYMPHGAPYCNTFQHISISHSKKYCGVVTSNQPVGLDIQFKKENIHEISNRFLNLMEKNIAKNKNDNIHFIWCTKEAIYKTLNGSTCSFKENIIIKSINKDNIKATFVKKDILIKYNVNCQKIDNYFITIATIKND